MTVLCLMSVSYTHLCVAIRVARRINSFGVLETMGDVMLVRGVPEHIRSDIRFRKPRLRR